MNDTDMTNRDELGRTREAALDFAWKWFEYHAQQRLSVFRFYLIVVGAIGAAYFAALTQHHGFPAFVVALVGCAICFFFSRLDQRVSQLVKLGENVIEKEQERFATILGYDDIKIIRGAETKKNRYFSSYSQVFRGIFWWFGIAFFIGAIYALVNI